MSRRKIMTLASIAGGLLLLPIGGAAAYLIHQKLTDPHLLSYDFHGAVLAACWSPDGRQVATVGWVALPGTWGTQALKVFNPQTGDTLLTGDTSREVVSGIAPLDVVWSADGLQLVAFIGQSEVIIENGSRAIEMVQVWDAKTGQRVRSFPVTQPITEQDYGGTMSALGVHAWALSDRYLVAEKRKNINPNGQGGVYSILEVWDIETGSMIFTQDMRGSETNTQVLVRDMQWAPDRRRLAIVTIDGLKTLRWEIWDIPTEQQVQAFPMTYSPDQPPMVWSPDGTTIAVGQDVYDVATGRKVMTYQLAGQQTLEVMAWLPGEKQVAVRSFVYSGGGMFRRTINPLFVLDASNSRILAQYDDIGGSLRWSPNGASFLALDETAGMVALWNTLS